jgi:hypothetical protein
MARHRRGYTPAAGDRSCSIGKCTPHRLLRGRNGCDRNRADPAARYRAPDTSGSDGLGCGRQARGGCHPCGRARNDRVGICQHESDQGGTGRGRQRTGRHWIHPLGVGAQPGGAGDGTRCAACRGDAVVRRPDPVHRPHQGGRLQDDLPGTDANAGEAGRRGRGRHHHRAGARCWRPFRHDAGHDRARSGRRRRRRADPGRGRRRHCRRARFSRGARRSARRGSRWGHALPPHANRSGIRQ